MNDDNDGNTIFKHFIPERPADHPSRRGRPKGSVNKKPIVTKVAFEKHKSKDRKGKTITLTTIERLLQIIQEQAMLGNHRFAALRDREFGPYIDPEIYGSAATGVILAPAGLSAEDWIEEAERHNARTAALMAEIEREEG